MGRSCRCCFFRWRPPAKEPAEQRTQLRPSGDLASVLGPSTANAATIGGAGVDATGDTGTRGPDFCAANAGVAPSALVFTYEGSTCKGNCNSQAPTSVDVTGDPTGLDTVYITVADNRTPKTVLLSVTVSLASAVDPNSAYFTIPLATAGTPGHVDVVRVSVYNKKAGTLLSNVVFVTSCGQPMRQGDYFGSLRLGQAIP